MAQTKHQIEALLAGAGTLPRHRFGQNFMIDQNLVRLVAEAGELSKDDWVVEVGPGTGTLTEELLDQAGHVLAVEIDRDLAAMLRERFAARKNFTLIEGDALATKHALNPELISALKAAGEAGKRRKLVANLPYNIASPLVIELLIAGVDLLAFTVQKEVGLRLRAGAGTEDYGPLSVMAQSLADVEILRTLPPQAFWPSPSIDSALLRLARNNTLGDEAPGFGEFVHAIFSSRRKMLRKALAQAGYDAEQALAQTGFDGRKRPEELDPPALRVLYNQARRLKRP